MSEQRQMLPVWFFIGLNLFMYGVIIFASGLYEFSRPTDIVLANLHAPVWWGGIMVVVGGVYIVKFRPRGGS